MSETLKIEIDVMQTEPARPSAHLIIRIDQAAFDALVRAAVERILEQRAA